MAINFRKFFEGVGIRPKATSTANLQGEMDVTSSDGKLNYHNGTSSSPVLTEAHSATITNKTIDADLNTISNIGEAELADDAVATAKIQDLAVTDAKIAAGVDATKIADGSVGNTEFQYLDGVTSSIQTQLDDKANRTLSNLTGPTAINQDLIFDKAAPLIATPDALSGPTEGLSITTGDTPDATAGTITIDPGVGNGAQAETQITSDLRFTTPEAGVLFTDASNTFEYAIRPATATENVLIVLPPDQGVTGQALFTDGGGTTYWGNIPTAGANDTLSNLVSPTSINQDLLPSGNETRDIGSNTLRYDDIFVRKITTQVIAAEGNVSKLGLDISAGNAVDIRSSTVNPATLSLTTGDLTGGSGPIAMRTGGASGGTGRIDIATGDATGGSTGLISIQTGTPGAFAPSGNIELTTGATSGTRGQIIVDARQLSMSSAKIVDLDNPTNAQDAATKAYVDANGGKVSHQSVTGNTTLSAATSFVTADATSSNITITLQAASELKAVTIKRTDNNTTNYVRVSPASGTIDGASVVYISNQYEAITLIPDGTNWWVANVY